MCLDRQFSPGGSKTLSAIDGRALQKSDAESGAVIVRKGLSGYIWSPAKF
jgi:hypothetical protein